MVADVVVDVVVAAVVGVVVVCIVVAGTRCLLLPLFCNSGFVDVAVVAIVVVVV